jgi:hypothetical protein
MAKKQTNTTLSGIEAELVVLRARGQQLLDRQRDAAAALAAAQEHRNTLIIDGVDDVDGLARTQSNISECETQCRALSDAHMIVSNKLRELSDRRAQELRWQERLKIGERMTHSVAAICEAHVHFASAAKALIEALTPEAKIFECAQLVEHLTSACGEAITMQLRVITEELALHARGLKNPDVPNPFGIDPVPLPAATLPQPGAIVGQAHARAGADWPPKGGPHSNFPLGEVATPKQPPTREEILAQNRAALAQQFPSIYGSEDNRTAEEIFADEQRRLTQK